MDSDIMDFARTTGASGWKLFAKMRLPQALPQIFTGLKVGAALSAAAVAEFVASDKGLGYLLRQYNGNIEREIPISLARIGRSQAPVIRRSHIDDYRHLPGARRSS